MKYLIIAFIVLVGCSQTETATPVSTELPSEIVLLDYDEETGLRRGVLKSGDAVIEEGDVLQGQRHGTWLTYYPDGKIQTITSYLNGKKQGPEIQIDNSGYITTKSPYVQGNLNGEFKGYTRGRITDRRNYVDGKLHGLKQKYYPSGIIMEESTYVDGKIDGEARWYNQSGEVTIKYVYKMGELVDDGTGSED